MIKKTFNKLNTDRKSLQTLPT